MTQHRVEIAMTDKEGWQNWVNTLAAMVDELRDLGNPKVTQILDRYECRRCDYGMGLNVDKPDGPPNEPFVGMGL